MPACPEVRTELTLDEAFAVIEPYFLAVKEKFVGGGARRAKKTRLEIAPWAHDSPRHYAATEDTGMVVVTAPEFAELPPETVLAILSHEFGHAVDFLYPGDYFVGEDGEVIRMPEVPQKMIDKRAEEALFARMRAWKERDTDGVERAADAIAEFFTGKTIGYLGPCELQAFGRGRRPRRAGLR